MMKRLVVLVLLAGFVLSSCSSIVEKKMSAVETVEYYFEQFNNKNQFGMDSVVCDNMKLAESDLDDLNYVKLLSCTEETDPANIDFNDAWYDKEPYAIAVVNTIFEIKYKDGEGGGFSNGEYEWHYYLVKDSQNSKWIIVMWGVG